MSWLDWRKASAKGNEFMNPFNVYELDGLDGLGNGLTWTEHGKGCISLSFEATDLLLTPMESYGP